VNDSEELRVKSEELKELLLLLLTLHS